MPKNPLPPSIVRGVISFAVVATACWLFIAGDKDSIAAISGILGMIVGYWMPNPDAGGAK